MILKALTAKEAAEKLHISLNTLYDLLAAKEIPCRRIGPKRGRILIDEEDLLRYWESSKGAERNPAEGKDEIRMTLKHLRPPSPSRRQA